MTRSRITHLLCIVAITLVAALCTPIRSFAADLDCVSDPLQDGCACDGFDLQLDSSGVPHIKEIVFKDGRYFALGKGPTLTITNLATGAAVSLRGNGSNAQYSPGPDGTTTLVLTGHNVIVQFPTDVPPGPATTLYVGRVVYTIDSAGTWTLMRSSGTTLDICAALGG